MKKIIAYETPDKQRFFDENEARNHERRYNFGNQIDTAVRSNPQFARLDRDLLIDYFMQHGSTIGKLADSPISPEELRSPPAGYRGTLAERPTMGVLPHPESEGQRAREIMTLPGKPIDLASELDRELNGPAATTG